MISSIFLPAEGEQWTSRTKDHASPRQPSDQRGHLLSRL